MLQRPAPLPTTVEAVANNRPIKIAYLVPQTEAAENHLVLDAIFNDAYRRWGGGYTLLVPISNKGFAGPGYEQWLRHYDPDFLYTYVDLDDAFIERLDRLCGKDCGKSSFGSTHPAMAERAARIREMGR